MMLISILLAILTIGAVSASEDVDDALTVEDGGVDDVSTSVEDDGAILEDDGDNTNPENPQVEVKKEDFNVEIKNQFNLSDEDDYAISYSCSNNVSEGKIYVSVNNEEFMHEFEISQETIKLNNNNLYFKAFYEYPIDVYYCAHGIEGTDGLKLASGTVNVVKDLEKDDFEMYYNDGQIVDSIRDSVIFISNTYVNGTFIVTTDKGQNCGYKQEEHSYDSVDLKKLGIHENGTYEINVKFKSDDGVELDLATYTIKVDIDWNKPYDEYLDLANRVNLLDNSEPIVTVDTQYWFDGKLTIYIGDKSYCSKTIAENDEIDEIKLIDLNLLDDFAPGNYTVTVEYILNNGEKHSLKDVVEFYKGTFVTVPERMARGDDEYIVVSVPDGITGKVTVYTVIKSLDDSDDIINEFDSADIIDGVAKISLSSLSEEYYIFRINVSTYKCPDGEIFEKQVQVYDSISDQFTFDVDPNEIEFGQTVTLKCNGPFDEGGTVEIYLDDVLIYSKSDLTEVTREFTDLTVGKHKISFKYYDWDSIFYSNSCIVTVKEKPAVINQSTSQSSSQPSKKADNIKLTLKKVKVKKSAKKLVLTATLKINGKNAKKGTKVTFKFNGKTYKARTNAKGVAKVTIKKKVLKKLKVGKKVKYQVSYGKKTVKRTVKVKR